MRFIGEMQGIYLGSYKAYHPNYDIVYQDINGLRDLDGDMMDVNLNDYDYVIATPPCNYWSRAAGNRHSQYAINTAHLLPDMIEKLSEYNKPWIVENVRNDSKFRGLGLFDYNDVWVFRIGRHTIWTNTWFNHWIPFDYEFTSLNPNNKGSCTDLNKRSDRQGNENVHRIIEKWLMTIHTQNPLV